MQRRIFLRVYSMVALGLVVFTRAQDEAFNAIQDDNKPAPEVESDNESASNVESDNESASKVESDNEPASKVESNNEPASKVELDNTPAPEVQSNDPADTTKKLDPTKIFTKMKKNGIVPHVIPELPKTILHVTYPFVWFKFKVQEGDGETFHEYATRKRPYIDWECSPLLYYTLFMTHINVTNYTVPFDDLEYYSPNPDRFIDAKQYHNWLVYNIPGCNLKKGIELFHYIAPKPMKEKEHRTYVFLMFKQKRKFNIELEEKKFWYFFPDWRFHNSHRWEFPIKEFMEKYELGELIAGNFFRGQHEKHAKLY